MKKRIERAVYLGVNSVTVEVMKKCSDWLDGGQYVLEKYHNHNPVEAAEIAKSELIKSLQFAITAIKETPYGAIPRFKYSFKHGEE